MVTYNKSNVFTDWKKPNFMKKYCCTTSGMASSILTPATGPVSSGTAVEPTMLLEPTVLAQWSPGTAVESTKLLEPTVLAQSSPGTVVEPTMLAQSSPGMAVEPTMLAQSSPGMAVEPTMLLEPTVLAQSSPGMAEKPTVLAQSSSGTAVESTKLLEPTVLAQSSPGTAVESTKLLEPTVLAQSSPGMAVEPTVSKTVDGSVIPVHAGEEGLAYVYAISNPVTSFGSSCDETGHSVSLLLIDSSQLVFDPSSSFQMIGNEGVQLCQTYDNCSEPVESDTAEVGVGPMKAVAAGSKKVQSSTTEVRISPMKAVRAGCKKVYDRKNFCLFCSKCIRGKISQHLIGVHREEPRVIDIALQPKGSAKRRLLLGQLANEGNFRHNANVLGTGNGQIVIARRKRKNSGHVMQYLPCEYCKKFFCKDSLWRHYRRCSERPESKRVTVTSDTSDKPAPRHNGIVRGRLLLSSAVVEEGQQNLTDLLSHMRDDSLKQVVVQDSLIRRFVELRMDSLGRKVDQKVCDVHRVSQAARTLARLVKEAQQKQPQVSLSELLTPAMFDIVVATAKALTTDKEVPALNLARTIGHLLRHVVMVKSGQALRENDETKQKQAADFRRLLDAEWNCRVNSTAVKQLNAEKRSKVLSIPLTEDLVRVRNYICNAMKEVQTKLTKNANPADWIRLAKLAMSRLIMFNKRRRAEVKDLKVQQFLQRPNWNSDSSGELALALSPVDRLLASR